MAKKVLKTPAQSPTHVRPQLEPVDPSIVFDEDVERARAYAHKKYFEPYGRETPQHVLHAFKLANEAQEIDRGKAIKRAIDKAEISYYAAWARGEIKTGEQKPMPEETKERLRQLNKERREQAKKDKAERQARLEATDTANGVVKPKQKLINMPVFSNKDAQNLAMAKYPHIIAGTFRQDPEKAGGTCVDIRCTKCGAARSIHLADVFQCRLCLACRKAK